MLTYLLLMAQIAAFPGAQGGGAPAAGGRGGVVFEVTNLNDSGTGSLRACIDALGPRTCLFRISGLITFLSRAQVSNPFLTIAGQTAPGGGIVVGGPSQNGEQIFVSTHDVVIRYLTCDGNSPKPTGPDTGTVCFEMASGSNIYNVVWDHISARWMGNKVFPLVSNTAGTGVHNMVIQWSLVYEPNVQHAVGIGTLYVDSGGSAMATTDDDAHHNMFVTVDHRLPLNQSGNHTRWVNNLVYNYGQAAAVAMGGIQSDYIGNKYVDGKSISAPGQGGALNYSNSHNIIGDALNCDPADPTGDCPPDGANDNKQLISFYQSGNQGRNGATYGAPLTTPTNGVNDASQTALNWQGAEGGDNSTPDATGPMPASWYRAKPLPAEQFPIIADPVANLDNVLIPTVGNSQHLNCDGTWASNRDSQDARVINVYQNRLPDDLFYGQFTAPAIPAGTPCAIDIDGIYIAYKQRVGLPVGVNVGNNTASNGDTNFNNFINGASSAPPVNLPCFGTSNCPAGTSVSVIAQAAIRQAPLTGGGAGTQIGTINANTAAIIKSAPVASSNPTFQWVLVAINNAANCTTAGPFTATCGYMGNDNLTPTGTPPPTPPTVTCTPPTVQTGGIVACASNQTVTWSASAGSITQSGVLTAPTTAQTVTVTATNANGSGTAPIVVTAPPVNPNIVITCVWNPATGAYKCSN
jgi:pectate lyase